MSWFTENIRDPIVNNMGSKKDAIPTANVPVPATNKSMYITPAIILVAIVLAVVFFRKG